MFTVLNISNRISYYESKIYKENTNDINLNKNEQLIDEIIDISLIICSIGVIGFILVLFPKYYHYYIYYKQEKYLNSFDNFFYK